MDSWRIGIKEINRSSTVSLAVGKTGAMVLKSARGPKTPVFFSTGETQRIIDMFGTPNVGNEQVWDAVEYNRKAPMWLCTSFLATDKVDTVAFTSTGAAPAAADTGLTGDNIVDPAFSPYTGSSPATAYFTLVCKFPAMASFLKFTTSYSITTGLFTITVYILRGVNYEVYNTYKVGLSPSAKGDYGVDAYIVNVFANDDLLQVYLNPLGVYSAFVATLTAAAFSGGSKTAAGVDKIAASWENWAQAGRYPTNIFMDPTSDTTLIPAKFDTLSKTNHKYADFLFILPQTEVETTAVTTKTGLTIDNRNIHFGYNWANVTDTQTGNTFYSNLVGRHGGKYADMSNVFNALSPSWVDENGHGGQLGSGINFFVTNPSEDNLQILDAAGINARIMHNTYGAIISSDKTGKNPATLSHDSFVGTSRLFNFIMKNIVDQVLTFQITKLNDEVHRRLAVQKARLILDPIKNAGLLDNYVIQCDASNNDATARSLKKFVFALAVWPVENSQGIDFAFVKANSVTSVTSAFLGLQ